jgi:hypothetical protein
VGWLVAENRLESLHTVRLDAALAFSIISLVF